MQIMMAAYIILLYLHILVYFNHKYEPEVLAVTGIINFNRFHLQP
jgi:hypothetical protein